MSTTSIRFVPGRWLALSARSARLRLTLMYSGMFLVLGTAVIAIIFLLVWTGTAIGEDARQVSPIPGPGVPLFRSAATQQHSADVARLLAVSWFALALTAAASALLGWFAAGRVLRPLRNMTATARTISAGNLHQRLRVSGPDDEFKQLGDTIDDLLARLEASFAGQRRFVANAAHELRTPLTLERTLLQVALADPGASAATLRATCEELLASGRNHERLLNALLTLASSERGLDRREPVDLRGLAERAIESARAGVGSRGLELTTSLEPATVRGDPALLDCLAGNLIDNAVRYNRQDGWFEVRTAVLGEAPVLSVVNTGPYIGPEEVERLFEPFQRLEQSRTGSTAHSGLGLSIVRAIAIAHDATVSAVPRPDGGLAVTVSFPATESVA
jgi:signal transduction histidine kinase